jgi:hypothetical protein
MTDDEGGLGAEGRDATLWSSMAAEAAQGELLGAEGSFLSGGLLLGI